MPVYFFPGFKQVPDAVITSYSIHYTKLYEVPGKRVLEIGCGLGFGTQALAEAGCQVLAVALVITSYSIHYTKLYEGDAPFNRLF